MCLMGTMTIPVYLPVYFLFLIIVQPLLFTFEKVTSLTFPGTERINMCLGDHNKGKKHREAVEEAKMRNVTATAMLKEVVWKEIGLANMLCIILWLAKEDIDSLCNTLWRCGRHTLQLKW